jgi:hypothetical protein
MIRSFLPSEALQQEGAVVLPNFLVGS